MVFPSQLRFNLNISPVVVPHLCELMPGEPPCVTSAKGGQTFIFSIFYCLSRTFSSMRGKGKTELPYFHPQSKCARWVSYLPMPGQREPNRGHR